jgi:hypothetical protein
MAELVWRGWARKVVEKGSVVLEPVATFSTGAVCVAYSTHAGKQELYLSRISIKYTRILFRTKSIRIESIVMFFTYTVVHYTVIAVEKLI